ncbi:MAG: hypothetical protein CME32_14235 [Gimesia sp.]|nr:hypothetical protein [Gimesia sp.]
MSDIPKISPFLWFDNNAEEAIDYYTSIFKNSKRFDVSRYGEGGPGPAGSVMVAAFELEGQRFTALNGGPLFKFNEAISFVVNCDSQDEIDEYWEKLSAGGEPGQCGWLKDRFGVSWQIVPTILPELMQTGDAEKTSRVMAALMQMTKLEIDGLQRAFDGA